MVELHESLQGFDIWREVATVTDRALKRMGWNHLTVVIRAMGQLERELEKLNDNDAHVVQTGEDHFEFAFDTKAIEQPGLATSIKKWVDIQIIGVIDQFLGGPDDLDEEYASDEDDEELNE